MTGDQRARLTAVSIDAQRSFCAARASNLIWARSCANDCTTRTPWMFSSTTVAISAMRAWTTHDRGNTFWRSLSPDQYTPGIVDSATSVRPTCIDIMYPNASTNVRPDINTSGPNASSNWIDRTSELAREITWPDCVRS